jgi:type VI secretion system secreted protein VgrG
VEGSSSDDDVINSLGQMQEIRPNKYALADFNFETPNNTLKADIPGKYKLSPDDREIYDYPGDYTTKSAGDKMVRVRMEEEEAQLTTVTGSGSVRAFTTGYRFALLNSFRKDMNNKEFVLTSVSHNLSQSQREGGESNYENSFTCIPVNLPFRPPRTTPKPVVQGAQTAIVSGPAGEEIYTDKYGRIKVQFHWDRIGKRNDTSSCWIRVGQAWAGNSWGSLYIPRIGQEVIVDFIEGDPDRPLITGSVYHAVNMPPYPLPAEKTKSTIKSRSTLGGGGFNEFRFEDKKGQEEVYLHGQKDWNIRILNNKNQTVGHDETLAVGNNRTKTVGVNQSETIGANKTITVGLDHTETITKNMTLTVGMLATETVGINKTETIGAAKELTIGGAYQVTVGGALNETVGGAKMEEVGGYRLENVGGYKTDNVGEKYTLDAGDEISLKCGASSIVMKSDGKIEIIGTDVTLKTSAGKVHIDEGGIISINGSMVKINT